MPVDTPTAWVLTELARQFAAVVSTMTGAEASAEPTRPDDTAPDTAPDTAQDTAQKDAASPAESLIWIQPFDLAEGTTVVLAAPPETWRVIGAKPLEAAGLSPDEIDEESCRSTFLEILNQTMGALGSQAGAKANRQVLPTGGQEAAAWPEGYAARSFQITLAGSFPLAFQIAASTAWENAWNPPVRPGEAGQENGNETGLENRGEYRVGESDKAGLQLAQHSRTFDLLLEVELPVSISFGRALVPLREVAKLTSGSVVELNRTVSDPVEIIVNNCVIARGEVVVIEGNYGVRIQQIISPQERLRTLH